MLSTSLSQGSSPPDGRGAPTALRRPESPDGEDLDGAERTPETSVILPNAVTSSFKVLLIEGRPFGGVKV